MTSGIVAFWLKKKKKRVLCKRGMEECTSCAEVSEPCRGEGSCLTGRHSGTERGRRELGELREIRRLFCCELLFWWAGQQFEQPECR